MPQVQRDREIKRRRQRKMKMQTIRQRLEQERDGKVRARLIAKLKKISPSAPAPEK